MDSENHGPMDKQTNRKYGRSGKKAGGVAKKKNNCIVLQSKTEIEGGGERERGREREGQTDREIDIQIDRQTDRRRKSVGVYVCKR